MPCLIIIFIFFSLENNDMILVQISFDGNNSENPPNLMTDDTFERIQIRLKRKFASYINIVYTGKHNFEDCDMNRNAANKLTSLSKKEERRILLKKIVYLFVLVSPIGFYILYFLIKKMT